MSDKPIDAIWTPDGMVALGEKSLERVELRAGVGELLRQAADVFVPLKLGIHCSLCGADLVGRNSDSARVYSVACKCREFIWSNRDYREPTSPVH